MFKTKILPSLLAVAIFTTVSFDAFARAGGRSSFGGGRSSSSFSNQGSRGSRTYDGGSYGSKNYAPVNKSVTAPKSTNQAAPNAQNPNGASSFFQRNPFMSAVGGALVGSWIGHMIFGGMGGGMGMGGYGSGAGSSLINILLIALIAGGIWFWIRSTNRKSVAGMSNDFDHQNYNNVSNFNNAISEPSASSNYVNQNNNIELPQSEQNKFAQMLTDVQEAWSTQNLEALKKLVTVEMYKYFTDALNQNLSQNLVNKVENIKVQNVDLSEAWREDESEYATIILEWLALDYTYNVNKNSHDADYITEGDNQNQSKSSEAWTFVRYGSNGKWILSAIQQIS
jgi:predicted lipid-binding transport protein (Tim44 family)